MLNGLCFEKLRLMADCSNLWIYKNYEIVLNDCQVDEIILDYSEPEGFC